MNVFVELKKKANRVAAVVVLGAVALWIAVGTFGTSGSRPTPNHAARTAEMPARKVGFVTAAVTPYRSRLIVSGRTEANKTVAISTRGPGIVDELPLAKGSVVAEGAVVARLADEGRTATLRQAEAIFEQRRAEWEAASRLSATGSGTRLNLVAAKSAVDSAAAALELARVEVDKRTLASPIAGVLDQIPIERGQSVAEGRLVATVLSLDPIVVAGEVSERSIARVQPGRAAEIRLVSGQTVAGKVSYVSRAAAEKTRTYRFEVEAPNADLAIAAGLTAEIAIAADPVAAVRLPRSVLSLGDDGAIGIRLVGSDGRVAFARVDILDDTPEGLWLGGIPDGTRVIVAGQEFARIGDAVIAEALP